MEHSSILSSTKVPEAWYAVQTRPCAERSTAAILTHKGYEVFYPVRRRPHSPRLESPLFAGYLFCRTSKHVCGRIVTTPGVVRLLGIPGGPEPIPDEEVEGLRRMAEQSDPEVQSTLGTKVPELATAQRVRVLHGPLRGVVGQIVGEAPRRRFVVCVQMLQRAVSVTLDPRWLQPESQAV